MGLAAHFRMVSFLLILYAVVTRIMLVMGLTTPEKIGWNSIRESITCFPHSMKMLTVVTHWSRSCGHLTLAPFAPPLGDFLSGSFHFAIRYESQDGMVRDFLELTNHAMDSLQLTARDDLHLKMPLLNQGFEERY